MAKTVAIIAALDTKGAEAAYIRDAVARHGHDTLLIDVGVLGGASIAHMGLTVGGSIGLESGDAMRLEDCPAAVQAIGDAARAVNGETMLLCHGGPIATPADAAYVLARCDAVGFVGASSMERLPVETAITETTRAFKAVPLRGGSEYRGR